MNIVLIGFMGSGKSTVAKQLSEIMGYSLVEMDQLVYQKTASKDMYEVFEKGGELLLRETEIEIAKEYAKKERQVISTGGGVILNKIILDYFKENGAKVFFLHADFDHIAKRLIKTSSRPLFQNLAEARKLYDFRLPIYMHYADEVLDVNAKTADEIILNMQGLCHGF